MPKRLRPAKWSYSYGEFPFTVVATERAEDGRRPAVLLRWTDPDKVGRDRRKKTTLPLQVRDDEGRVHPLKAAEVERRVRELSSELALGRGSSPTSKAPPAALTIAQGLAMVLNPDGGKYPDPTERRYKELCAIRDRLLSDDPPMLPPRLAWEQFTPSVATALWRKLRAKNPDLGPRHAEIAMDLIYASASWLRSNHVLPSNAAMPSPNWRKDLKAEWQKLGWRDRKAQPRHSPEEWGRIIVCLHQADPRLRLAMELGAELRLGQVVRTLRNDLHLDEPGTEFGCIDFPRSGKKSSDTLVLTATERQGLDDVLTWGYLAELEAAWRAKRIANYPLFPARRLVKGFAKLRDDTSKAKPLDRSGLLKMFHALETVAEVASVPGRGWYGIRRLTSDLAENETQDSRVLDRLQGWQDATTRQKVYQQRNSLRLSAQAAIVRQAIRDRLPRPGQQAAPEVSGPPGPPEGQTNAETDPLGARRGMRTADF